MEPGAVIKHDIKKAPSTGEWRYMKPRVLEEKCTACKVCIPFCPEAAIDLMNIKEIEGKGTAKIRKIIEIDYEFCKGCGVCADVCPQKAIIMTKNDSK
ncbi:MAG: 4Fe-4S binding protein [Patescibacteria group bacterium]